MVYNFDNLEKMFKEEKEEVGCGAVILMFLLVLAVCFGACCLSWWIGMLLWNGVLCAIFTSILTITFWQFAGINILTSILFENMRISSSNNKK